MWTLDLFAGAGGSALAGKLLGWRSVGYVELDPYCRHVLAARIRDGILDDAPIIADIRTFDGRPWAGIVDCVTAGFPCQPFSVAGKRRGADDARNLWPETARLIREIKPRFVLLENVPGLLSCVANLCVCGRADRRGGMHWNTEISPEEWRLLLCRSVRRYDIKGDSCAQPNENNIWRHSDSEQKANQEVGECMEMAYWWGRRLRIPRKDIEFSTVEATSGDFGALSPKSPKDVTPEHERSDASIEHEGSETISEWGICDACGRRVGDFTAISGRYFGDILRDLAELGFDAEWGVLSASTLGAPHQRRRLWIVAHADQLGQREQQIGECGSSDSPEPRDACAAGEASELPRWLPGWQRQQKTSEASRARGWSAEPGVCGVAHGVAHRAHRLRALGNGWVPPVAARAFAELSARARRGGHG